MVARTRRAAQASPELTPTLESPAANHWLVLGAGVAVWAVTRSSPLFLVRTLGLIAGSALVGRAASGRGGLSKVLRFTPVGRRIK